MIFPLAFLGKTDEAEVYARKSIAVGGDGFWLAKLTLAELLVARKANPDEAMALLREVSRHCPVPMRAHVQELKRKVGARR